MKRRLIDNPFVKAENQSWELSPPKSLHRSVSPPPTNRRLRDDGLERRASSSATTTPTPTRTTSKTKKSDTAAVEAGEVQIEDHVSFFSAKLLAARRPEAKGQPRLSHDHWLELYQRNLHDRGHHFVIHQHDHPVAGTHYDLRLQCNATSSISFAIMYGLPGDPNSKRLNRNATETRVHNLWNHLIETASHETGTMLLWDTGEYTVLPYPPSSARTTSNDNTDTSDSDADSVTVNEESEPWKLHREFQNRKVKLRLHGTRLPKSYTISLRLHPENDRVAQPEPPAFKRRRTIPPYSDLTGRSQRGRGRAQADTSDSSRPSSPDHPSADSEEHEARKLPRRLPRTNTAVPSLHRTASPPKLTRGTSSVGHQPATPTKASASTTPERSSGLTPQGERVHDEGMVKSKAVDEDALIRRHNAYPGATNSINSIHQRRWFLSLDRAASGFRPTNEMAFGRRVWERAPTGSMAENIKSRHVAGSTKIARASSVSRTALGKNGAGKAGAGADQSPQPGEPPPLLAGFEPFYVLGRDVETSILTGRTAADVAKDEGLVGYRPRGGWRPVTD